MIEDKAVPKLVSAFIVLLLILSTIQVPKASAFSSESFEAHETITNAALKKFGFSSSSIEEVTDANLAQDSIICYGPLCPGISNTEIPDYHGDR